jgi:hypothetical protein
MKSICKTVHALCTQRSRCGTNSQSSLSLPFGDAGRRELSLLIESHAPAPLRAADAAHEAGGVAYNGL